MKKGDKRGYTLMELIIVVVIISMLLTLATVSYMGIQEESLNKDCKAALRVMRAAEMSHKIDMGTYYPLAGSDPNIATINSNLKVSLPSAANRSWDYEVWSTGCVRATRNGGDGRSWYLTIDDADDTPDAGAGCP